MAIVITTRGRCRATVLPVRAGGYVGGHWWNPRPPPCDLLIYIALLVGFIVGQHLPRTPLTPPIASAFCLLGMIGPVCAGPFHALHTPRAPPHFAAATHTFVTSWLVTLVRTDEFGPGYGEAFA